VAAQIVIDEILTRHGIVAQPTLLAQQGVGAFTWRAGDYIVKIAREGTADEMRREAFAGPAARAFGVRTPALFAEGDGAYNIWERVDGEPVGDRRDLAVWRDVGRQLARLHTIELRDDQSAILRRDDKRDARPHLHALPPERAEWFARWLDRLERVPPAPPRMLHYDVHERNVFRTVDGATLIDWGDSGWGDPAKDFGSIPIAYVPEVLAGYEEQASLDNGAEARILRAVLGQSVRMRAQKGWLEPLDELMSFVAGDVPARWRDYLLYE
jgi:aminoglycoside phosphotransferase (APT) family kinase protein